MKQVQVLALVLLLTGCNWLLPLAGLERSGADGPAGDIPVVPDAPAGDRPGPSDASWLPACAATGDGKAVAAYLIDPGNPSLESWPAGLPDGVLHGGATFGTAPCGVALEFNGRTNMPPDSGPYDMGLERYAHAAIPDDAAWHLPQGEISFFLKLADAGPPLQGVLSRDAMNVEKPGHLAVVRANNRLLARLQSNPASPVAGHACSEVLQNDTWYRVRIGFGQASGLSLEVTDTKTGQSVAQHTGLLPAVTGGADDWDCGDPGPPVGIDGNQNVWVLGALGWGSDEGATIDKIAIDRPLAGGIAALVIRDLGP